MAAHQKNQFQRFLLRPLYKLNKSARIERPAGGIQKYFAGSGMPLKQ